MKELSSTTGLSVAQIYKWKWDKQEAIKKYNMYRLETTSSPFATQKVEGSETAKEQGANDK